MYKALIFLILLVSFACQSDQQSDDKAEVKKTYQFHDFKMDDFKAVVFDCDLGRVKLHVYAYGEPKMEIHETYQKYISFETHNDTLFLTANKTPKKSQMPELEKHIRLYTPHLSYIKTSATELLVKAFTEDHLEIVNDDSSLRMIGCKLDKSTIRNQGTSTIYLESTNYIHDLIAYNNDKSSFVTYAFVDKSFTMYSKDLKKVNFVNITPNGFKWSKTNLDS